MRQFTLRPWVSLILLLAIALPLCARARSPKPIDAVDLSILEQPDSLIPYMSATQKLEYLNLERAMEAAQSGLRSGQHLANTKPSPLAPDRDIKPTVERGKALIAQSEAAILRLRLELVQLLEAVDSQKERQEAVDLKKYDYTLESSDFEQAWPHYARQLLESCWALGYETLFFDGVYIHDSEGTRQTDAHIRNRVYDVFVEIDGTTFSVTIPVDFRLKAETTGKGSAIFNYENAPIFKNDKKALLALELIVPGDSATGLLSLRAIDLNTQAIAAQHLVKINDLAAVLAPQSEETNAPESAESKDEAAEAEDRIARHVRLRDPQQTIDALARLSEPYSFQIVEATGSGHVAACLGQTLLHNSGLMLVDSDFIQRAYGHTLEAPETWVGQANARLTLEADDEAGDFQVQAQAEGSDRVLTVGRLILSDSEEE
jgi:hypothetical protein